MLRRTAPGGRRFGDRCRRTRNIECGETTRCHWNGPLWRASFSSGTFDIPDDSAMSKDYFAKTSPQADRVAVTSTGTGDFDLRKKSRPDSPRAVTLFALRFRSSIAKVRLHVIHIRTGRTERSSTHLPSQSVAELARVQTAHSRSRKRARAGRQFSAISRRPSTVRLAGRPRDGQWAKACEKRGTHTIASKRAPNNSLEVFWGNRPECVDIVRQIGKLGGWYESSFARLRHLLASSATSPVRQLPRHAI